MHGLPLPFSKCLLARDNLWPALGALWPPLEVEQVPLTPTIPWEQGNMQRSIPSNSQRGDVYGADPKDDHKDGQL